MLDVIWRFDLADFADAFFGHIGSYAIVNIFTEMLDHESCKPSAS